MHDVSVNRIIVPATRQCWSLLSNLWKILCVIFWSAESYANSPLVNPPPTPTVREDRNVVVVTDGLPEEEEARTKPC